MSSGNEAYGTRYGAQALDQLERAQAWFRQERDNIFQQGAEGLVVNLLAPKETSFTFEGETDDYRVYDYTGFTNGEVVGIPWRPQPLSLATNRLYFERSFFTYPDGEDPHPRLEAYVPFKQHGSMTLLLGRTAFSQVSVEYIDYREDKWTRSWFTAITDAQYRDDQTLGWQPLPR